MQRRRNRYKKRIEYNKDGVKKVNETREIGSAAQSIRVLFAKFDEVFKDVAEKKITEVQKENKKFKMKV